MDLKQVMRDYFLDLDAAAEDPNRKVAWCTSAGPAEILRAMGFEVFFPENHGAMLGATRVCMDTIPTANSQGYSPEICSYLTSDVGAYLRNITPLTKAYGIEAVPKPDVLVYNTNQCKDVMHWFEFYANEFKAPIFGIHSPSHLPEVLPEHINDVVEQFKRLIGFLSKITERELDEAELVRRVALSKDATDLWSEVLRTAMAEPSPLNFFDATIYMGPIVVLRGTEIARDYYQYLLAELEQKIADNGTEVRPKHKRIYWDGMPVWGRLRHLSKLFEDNNTSVVASTYCNSWIFSAFDPNEPLIGLARAYLEIFINRNDAFKEKYIADMVKMFSIDGVIFHAAKTCPNNSNSYYNLPGRLKKKGISTIVVDGDLCDLRCFSDEQSTNVIEAFLETL